MTALLRCTAIPGLALALAVLILPAVQGAETKVRALLAELRDAKEPTKIEDFEARRTTYRKIFALAQKDFSLLVKELDNPDAGIRGQGATSIAKIARFGIVDFPEGETLQAVLRGTRDRDAGVRGAAVRAVTEIVLRTADGKTSHAGITSGLLPATSDKSADVRLGAVAGLRDLAAAKGGQVPARAEVVAALCQAIRDEDSGVQVTGRQGLERLGRWAVPSLAALLKTDRIAAQDSACLVLERIGPTARAAVPALVKILAEAPESWIRSHAAQAIGAIGASDRATVTALVHALSGDDPDLRHVRYEAAGALIRVNRALGKEKGLPILVKGLKTEDPLEREAVCWTLIEAAPELAEKLAVPVLIDLFKVARQDPRRWFWDNPAQLLGRLGPRAKAAVPAIAEYLDSVPTWYPHDTIRALERIGPSARAAIPALVRKLSHKNYGARLAAGRALVAIDPAAATQHTVPLFIDVLKCYDAELRKGAAEVLGKIGPPAAAAVPKLKEALKDEYPMVREAATRALKSVLRAGPKTD